MAQPAEGSEIKDMIAVAIYRHAPSSVEESAQAILTELRAAGFDIRRADSG